LSPFVGVAAAREHRGQVFDALAKLVTGPAVAPHPSALTAGPAQPVRTVCWRGSGGASPAPVNAAGWLRPPIGGWTEARTGRSARNRRRVTSVWRTVAARRRGAVADRSSSRLAPPCASARNDPHDRRGGSTRSTVTRLDHEHPVGVVTSADAVSGRAYASNGNRGITRRCDSLGPPAAV